MTLDQILDELEDAEAWKVRAVCASAAERVAPLFRRFARPASLSSFDGGLDAVWAAVESGHIEKIKPTLRKLPESRADDPHARDYYAGLALVVLLHAVDYASSENVEKAQSCIDEIASLCDDIDTTLTSAPGQTYRFDPKNPPPPGEIETKELQAQSAVLGLLRDRDEPTAALVDSLRQRARADAAIYEAVIPQLASS